jgi:hypothetical protein
MLYVGEVCQVSWYQGVQEKSSMDCHGTSGDPLWGLFGALDIPAFGRCIVQRECLDVLRAFHNMAVGRCPLGLSGKVARISFQEDPRETKEVAKSIPSPPGYLKPPILFLLGGVLPVVS